LKESILEGLKTLIEEVLIQKYDNYLWMGWRKEKLWTLEVDDLYKANLAAMKKLYQYFFITKKTKTFYIEDCMEIFCSLGQLDLLPE